ncbi:cell cycle checkpoint protein RAD17 [Cephus cinctus]|uniref:Cell cycle checkpoint protein RAD17 n=1 Tax=Cephus cinctus TaxID=211228 RepID=A0AAJ7W2M2_CEPCN|nr:cell cycle checkpoint protein RAD17 [Cephus cinctus]
MSQSKKSKGDWLLPSFEIAPNTSHIKKRSSTDDSCSNKMNVEDDICTDPKRKSSNNLAALLMTCEPQQPSELAISRQKQKTIQEWLDSINGSPKALVLSGPSGCGKTVALKLLAKNSGFDVIEWITPVDQAMDENNRVMRQGERFEDFMVRATRYNSIFSKHSRRLLLVKDIPNVYLVEKDSFSDVLQKYFEMAREPLVFVVSDSGSSRLMQTLFSENIRKAFKLDVISIGAATATSMKNVLKRVSSILNLKGGHILNVTQENIDEILSNGIGDVRSAILNLIFISLKVPNNESHSECTVREESLGLLHGVGRVINPKRIPDGDSWKFVHDPDEIASLFQSQPGVFLGFLHGNYLNTIGGMDEAATCINILSLSDTLISEWRDPNLGRVALSYCIRGLMVTNEKPVSGWNPVRKGQHDDRTLQRDLGAAELRWYESRILSKTQKSENSVSVAEIEGIIE